jgi:GNAT superfamily N-acetyltransferase
MQLKPIIDEKIVWFGYYYEEPIAFFIMLPEMNQIFKHVNGKLDWLGKLKFVWHKWRKTCNKMFGLVFGIVPDHQGKGVEGALIMAARQMVQDDYHFNPKMLRVAEQVGGYIAKTHVTYRKLFDETKEFKRHPLI